MIALQNRAVQSSWLDKCIGYHHVANATNLLSPISTSTIGTAIARIHCRPYERDLQITNKSMRKFILPPTNRSSSCSLSTSSLEMVKHCRLQGGAGLETESGK